MELSFYDVNCFIGRWHTHHLAFETVEGLAAEMERLHIRGALVNHIRAWRSDPVEGNAALVQEIAGRPTLRPVMALTPLLNLEFGGAAAVEAFAKKHDVAAIRIYPKDQTFTLNPFNLADIFEVAASLKLPVMVDFQQLDGRYDLLYQCLKAWPKQPVVLIQPHYLNFRTLFPMFRDCPNLYGDTTVFKGFDAVEMFVNHFGSQRLLFGTRIPFIEGSLPVGRLIYADIHDADKENIAWKNAERLFGKGGAN